MAWNMELEFSHGKMEESTEESFMKIELKEKVYIHGLTVENMKVTG